ncbi:MAG: hypothetical protein IAI50_14595, partial [Candidatus Eremiobacteraeota bacterium]|nr:hypothetical protein [Candidatus Eremiobacteraeota bacterium]
QADMLRNALDARRAARTAANAETVRRQAQGQTAQATATPAAATPVPFSESLETPKPGFLHPDSPGLSYTADLNSTYSIGNTGYRGNNLKGGTDLSVYYAPQKYTRIFAGYYELSEYPVGFDTGTVPTYVSNQAAQFPVSPGFPANGRSYCGAFGPSHVNLIGQLPNCNVNLNNVVFGSNKYYQNDASVQNRLTILSLQKIVYVAGLIPIVISPTYVSRKGSIGGDDDVFLAWDQQHGGYHTIHLRQAETEQVLVSLPFANSSKLFGVYSIGPQWNVNINGNNQTNHAQIFQVLDLRYFANPTTTVFFQPSQLKDYLPNDPYPQHIPTIIAGVTHKLGGPKSPVFIQGFYAGGVAVNPVYGNTGRLGVIDVTCVKDYPNCVSFPNPRTNTAVNFGGFKATQFVLQVGIGTPSVIPL